MKRISFLIILIASVMILSSCGKMYKVAPGDQADFDRLQNGARIIAPTIEGEVDGKNVIQQPAAFFLKEARGTGEHEQGADYVFKSGAEAYMNMLKEYYGFELFYENLGYVYNTWCFVHPDSNKELGEYGSGYDIKVRHYYNASTSTTKDWLDVSLDGELFCFGDLGLRANDDTKRQSINGNYARDAILLRNGKYYNSSDEKLSVKSGVIKKTLYTYTKPFASQIYGFYGYSGRCSIIINGEKAKEYSAIFADYEDFNSSNTDMIFIEKDDGSKLVGITWNHEKFEVGKIYDLADFNASDNNNFFFSYDDNEFDDNDALCLTVRPIWLDRTGECESVVYFYGEFRNDEGEIYTLEGLLAAPFCLEENSEKYTSGSSSSGGGGSFDFPSGGGTYVPEFSKLDCLTCGGDGDCNTCNGYGKVDRYAGAGDYVTASCTSCYGSGNCRTCGGSGKRD